MIGFWKRLGGKIAIKTNDLTSPYFPIRKGVRQGEPFSPLLFNIAADGLACLVKKAQDEGLISHIIDKLLLTFSMFMILSSFLHDDL